MPLDHQTQMLALLTKIDVRTNFLLSGMIQNWLTDHDFDERLKKFKALEETLVRDKLKTILDDEILINELLK